MEGLRPMASSARKPVIFVKAGLTQVIVPSRAVIMTPSAVASRAALCSRRRSFSTDSASSMILRSIA